MIFNIKIVILVILHFNLLFAQEDSLSKIEAVTPPAQHGEGPFWDSEEQVLYYVDAFAPKILKLDPSQSAITEQNIKGDSVGIIIPIENHKNKFLVCRDRMVDLFSWDGKTNNTGTFLPISFVDRDKPENQFNDGKVDAKGRLWAGTLTRMEDLEVELYGGSLYVIEPSNFLSPNIAISKISISNGIAWSRDNQNFFYIDSAALTIEIYEFNLEDGTIQNPQVLFNLSNYEELDGILDGMTIDMEDNLWVALYGGKSVLKIDSKSGKLLGSIEIPATYVTSVSFGGPNLDVLYVTTSRLKLTEEEITEEPFSGSVFAVYGLNAQGYPTSKFKLNLNQQ